MNKLTTHKQTHKQLRINNKSKPSRVKPHATKQQTNKRQQTTKMEIVQKNQQILAQINNQPQTAIKAEQNYK